MIEIKALSKSIGKKEILKNIDLNIEDGKIVGLIGRNGAGKTTLLKTLIGNYRATSGSVKFDGETIDSSELVREVIFIDDKMSFPTGFSLEEIVLNVAKFYRNFDVELAFKLLEYFNLDREYFHYSLSKGMRSTFNSILGICAHCKYTFMDEPTTGMDISIRKDFYKALLKDYINYPRTIVISSHLLGEIQELLEEIILIDGGELVMHGTLDEFSEYGVELVGDLKKINLDESKVLYSEEVNKSLYRVIVRKSYLDGKIDKLKENGIKISGVSAENLCVYLTNRRKGGIYDVFK